MLFPPPPDTPSTRPHLSQAKARGGGALTQHVMRGMERPGLEFRECRERRAEKGGSRRWGSARWFPSASRGLLVWNDSAGPHACLRGHQLDGLGCAYLAPPLTALSPAHIPKAVSTPAKPDQSQGTLKPNGVTGQVLTQGRAGSCSVGMLAIHPMGHPIFTPGAPKK